LGIFNQLATETLGVTLNEGKALLAGVQDFVIAQQVYDQTPAPERKAA
jgi:hypothetical protein